MLTFKHYKSEPSQCKPGKQEILTVLTHKTQIIDTFDLHN